MLNNTNNPLRTTDDKAFTRALWRRWFDIDFICKEIETRGKPPLDTFFVLLLISAVCVAIFAESLRWIWGLISHSL